MSIPIRSRSQRWLGVKSFADASTQIRNNILAPSGGWLFDVNTHVSSATGLWDVMVLSALFIMAWATIRLSPKEISLILGNVFDVTIPLQHQLSENRKVRDLHASHLAGYWPALYCGLAMEVAGYFLVHPDLFTLVVCVKTTTMTIIWLGRSNGRFWTSQWYRARKSSSRPTVSTPAPATSGASRDKKKEWERQLREKGYTSDAGVKDMVDALAALPEKDQAKSVKEMLKASDEEVKKRNRKWGSEVAKPTNESPGPAAATRKSRTKRPSGSNETPSSTPLTTSEPNRKPRSSEPKTETPKPSEPASTPKPKAPEVRSRPQASTSVSSDRAAQSHVPWLRHDRPRDAWRGNMSKD